MEDIKVPSTKLPTQKERQEWEFKQVKREKHISFARSIIVKKQISEAYEILDKIDFDYVSDTAFREKVVRAKQSLENALEDFLLDEQYHREKIKEFDKMTLEEYSNQKDIWKEGIVK